MNNGTCERCDKATGEHSIECLFGHFMSYTGFGNQPENVQEMLFMAYSDGAAIHANKVRSD